MGFEGFKIFRKNKFTLKVNFDVVMQKMLKKIIKWGRGGGAHPPPNPNSLVVYLD